MLMKLTATNLSNGIFDCRQTLQCCDDFVFLPKEVDQTKKKILQGGNSQNFLRKLLLFFGP